MEMKIYDTLQAYNQRWKDAPAFVPEFTTAVYLYIWPSYGFQDERERSFYVEGICNHPYVKIVDTVAAADVILFVTVQQMKPAPNSDAFIDHMPPKEVVPKEKLICIDQADNMAGWGISPKGPGAVMKDHCAVIFKRSTVMKVGGVSKRYVERHSGQTNNPIACKSRSTVLCNHNTPW
jgi:hypothetical protein